MTAELHGQRFFVKRDGRLWRRRCCVALLFLEMSDIIFAVDSVPAIFAITKEPLIVFTSNIFAILGLRAMYFMLAGAVDKFHMLKYGLAMVLVFVGLKMVWLNEAFGGKFPISWSLGIILSVIAAVGGRVAVLPEASGGTGGGRAGRSEGMSPAPRPERPGPQPRLRQRKYTGSPRTMITRPGHVVEVRYAKSTTRSVRAPRM